MIQHQGKIGFVWFTAVVEDRNDPLFLNRVRIRIYGAHGYDKQKIASADLPWAEVMMPVTSSSLSGLGTTTHGLVEGSTVMGFYRDDLNMQDPVVIGSFIGVPQKYHRIDETIDDKGTRSFQEIQRTTTEGFNDPRLDSESSYSGTPDGPSPKHINRTYGLKLALDKSPKNQGGDEAINYPRESYIGTSDVNLLARATDHEAENTSPVKDAYPNNVIEAGGFGKTLYEGNSGKEERLDWVKPKYPFNHVYESESGHVIEIDDTPDYERINVFHRSGARIEINNKGEIHILAAPEQDMNLQAENINCRSIGKGGKVRIEAETKVEITAKEAAKIVSQGATDIISSGVTKITAIKDVVMKSVKKVKIQ